MSARPARDALRRMQVDHPEDWDRFCLHIAHFEGWDCASDLPRCRKRLLRVLNSGHRRGHAPRNLDVDWVLMALDFFPEDLVTPLFQRAAAVAQAKRELEAKRPEMRKVELEAARRRAAG